MNKGFWQKLKTPIVGLSPMDGVTDAPMRFITKKYGQPDVIYTEFVSVEGLWRIHKRGEVTHKIWRELKFDPSERPIVVQLFGSDPEAFFEATKIVVPMGFDGIDINMGCPSPGLEKRGGGAGLMRDFGLAREVVETVRKAAGIIPVSVKTRIGSSAPDPLWWKTLADMELPVVAMHGRTFKQLYKGEADWEVLKQAAEVIRESGALFLGNGDVKELKNSRNQELKESRTQGIKNSRNQEFKIELSSGEEKILEGVMDGVLIGRAAVGNPWALRKDGKEPNVEEKLQVALEHARVFEKNLPGNIPVRSFHSSLGSNRTRLMERTGGTGKTRFETMRKHLTWYSHGFDGAGGLRRKLVQTSNADEVEIIVKNFLMER